MNPARNVAVLVQCCESCGLMRRCELVTVDGQAYAVCSACAPKDAA